MAPVVAAAAAATPSSNKIKRHPPPGIQTNGVSSARSSPSQSPSISAKPPPVAGAKVNHTPTSAAINGVNGTSHRPSLSRTRRELSGQNLGRNARNNGLRSASLALDSASARSLEPRPEVITDEYILKKHAGKPPSLIVHLHQSHFRFDQQDSTFPYRSPMKVFLEHCKSRTIPHDLLPELIESGVSFYDGCLIVQIHDHKSVIQSRDIARPTSASSDTTPFSIHKYNKFITPSPYVPYPKQEMKNTSKGPGESDSSKVADTDGPNKENMPAPALSESQRSKVPPKARIRTIVLHPTPQSLQMDLMIKATTPRGSGDGKAADGTTMVPPPTPLSAMPSTPSMTSGQPPAKKIKHERMELGGADIYAAESEILLATAPPLHLEVAKDAEATIALLDRMADENHSEPPPQPKTRKRTVAERAADEALAADHEKYMLTFDERLSSNAGGAQGGVEGGDGNGQSGGATFEPRFERFKVIEEIKREHAEKREQEKIRQAEQERKLALQRQQQQAEQAQLLQQRQAQEQQEKLRREEASRQAARQQQENQRRMAAAQQQQAAAAAAAAAVRSPPNMQHQMSQASHGHPTPGTMPASLPPHRFPQQVSQAPVSSPTVRQNTPHTMSSPMVGNVPMQQTGSGMGGSPARPGSVVQNPVIGVPMAVSMSANGSQRSHPAGTPRMPNATPQMAHGTPITRPMATPRMTQASPPPIMMTQGSQMGQATMLMGGQSMPQMQSPMYAAQQMAAAQQRQRIAQQQQQQMAAMQNGMMNGQSSQQMQANLQQMQQQAALRQQMLNMQQNGGMFTPQQAQAAQLAQRYQQQLNMQNQMGGQQMGNQSFMNGNGMNPAQMAAMQQMQQLHMQQMQQQPQSQTRMLMQQRGVQQQILQRGMSLYNANIQNIAAQYGGNPPVEVIDGFRKKCYETAAQQFHQQWQNQMRMRQQQQMMQQQIQQMPNGAMQGM